MTLPQYPNQITLKQISEEFGIKPGSTSILLSDYYAGGGVVRAGTLGYPKGIATPIPSSGAIALSNFYGAKRKAIVNDFVQDYAYYSPNVGLAGREDSSYMYISVGSQTYLTRHAYVRGGPNPYNVAEQYGSFSASKTIGWRTSSVTSSDYSALSLNLGKYPQSIKNLYSYGQLSPVNEGDIIYYIYGVHSDDYGYIGFHIYDLDTGQHTVTSIGGDVNTEDKPKAWFHVSAGLRVINNKLDTSMFRGRKIILPYWRGIQAVSRAKIYSQEYTFAHARNPFGGADINGIVGLPDKGSVFQRMFIPNNTGLASPYPDVFEVVGTTMTIKQDIVVTCYVPSSYNNSYGFTPQRIPGLLLYPPNQAIGRTFGQERYSEYVPYIFNAGTYQLSYDLLPLYNPTIFVI